MYGDGLSGMGAMGAATAADFETMRPGEWTAQGVDPNRVIDPRDWNATMSTDPFIIAQVNAMLASGINPMTGRSTQLNQAVLTKGFTWHGGTTNPFTGQPGRPGDFSDSGRYIGNAFDMGLAAVQALPPASRGEIAPSPDDQTQYGYTPPAPAPANSGPGTQSPAQPSPSPTAPPPAGTGGPGGGPATPPSIFTPFTPAPFTPPVPGNPGVVQVGPPPVTYAPGYTGPNTGPDGDYFAPIGGNDGPAPGAPAPSSGTSTLVKVGLAAAVLYGLAKWFGK